jgi:hypothetical protein
VVLRIEWFLVSFCPPVTKLNYMSPAPFIDWRNYLDVVWPWLHFCCLRCDRWYILDCSSGARTSKSFVCLSALETVRSFRQLSYNFSYISRYTECSQMNARIFGLRFILTCQSLSIHFYGLINGVINQYFSTCGSVSLNDLEIKKKRWKDFSDREIRIQHSFDLSAAPTQVWNISYVLL